VRELRNLMERAAVLVAGSVVDAEQVRGLLPPLEAEPPAGAGGSFELERAVAEAERKAILRALAATGDSKAEAAALLGIGERTLWTKLKKHGL
jgi:DNA-binding NtrC family response regulator